MEFKISKKRGLKIPLLILALVFFVYILLPNPSFPNPPTDALQSREPADSETSLRRAYFTNFTREEVIAHYKKEFNNQFLLPTLRLNYPPEEAQTIIRDQTRSTFLEELTHPLRESIYINGFEPKNEKDAINIEGRLWRQKIIVRFVPSSVWVRVLVSLFTLVSVYVLVREYLLYGRK